MKKLMGLILVLVAACLISTQAFAQSGNADLQATLSAAIQEVGLEAAIKAQLEAGVPVSEIMAAVFAMPNMDPAEAIQAAILAGAPANDVSAAAATAGISPTITSAAISTALNTLAGRQGKGEGGDALAFTPGEGTGPVVIPGAAGGGGGGGFVSTSTP